MEPQVPQAERVQQDVPKFEDLTLLVCSLIQSLPFLGGAAPAGTGLLQRLFDSSCGPSCCACCLGPFLAVAVLPFCAV